MILVDDLSTVGPHVRDRDSGGIPVLDRDMNARLFQSTTMSTVSDRTIDFLNIDPNQIDFNDMCLGIARQPRFNGQTCGAITWTLDGHLDLGDRILLSMADRGLISREELLILRKLFAVHDSWEYTFGDVIKPFKNALAALGAGVALKSLERAGDLAIWLRFDISVTDADLFHDKIKSIDSAAFMVERMIFSENYKPPETRNAENCRVATAIMDEFGLAAPEAISEHLRPHRVRRLFESIFDHDLLYAPSRVLENVDTRRVMQEFLDAERAEAAMAASTNRANRFRPG
jgi:hypothetical protein